MASLSWSNFATKMQQGARPSLLAILPSSFKDICMMLAESLLGVFFGIHCRFMVVSVSIYSRCPRIPCKEKRLLNRSNFRHRNHRHGGRKARHASFTSLTGFQSITLKVLKHLKAVNVSQLPVSKTVLFLRHGIEGMGINTLSSNQILYLLKPLFLCKSRTLLHAALVACKISIFLPCLAAPKCHSNKGQCPHHGCHDPNPDGTSSWFDGFHLWKRVKKNAWKYIMKLLKQQNWSTGLKDDAQPLQAQNHDSSWSPLATLVCHKVDSNLEI